MANAKKKELDLDKLKSIGVRTGSSKTYSMDHKVIINPETGKTLVVAEKNDKGQSFVKTGDAAIQASLEGMGYKPNTLTKKMHTPIRNPGAKSRKQAEEDAK